MKNNFFYNDVINALFELGLIGNEEVKPNLSTSLKDELGLDSQELVNLSVTLSSLCMSNEALDEFNAETVQDLISYLEKNRDSWLPKDTCIVLQGSVVINKDIDTVFSYIENYAYWPDILSHVTKTETEYDDGKFQKFLMYIRELTTNEEYFVESWRYVNRDIGIIDFSQPKPPNGFNVHKGGWRFRFLDENKTELISYHGFSINSDIELEDAILLIRKHIRVALRTWENFGNTDV